MNIYYSPGQLVRLELECRNTSGALDDPSVLTLTVEQPGESPTTYTYGEDDEIVRDAKGEYHFDLTIPSTGRQVTYRWTASGAVADTFERTVFIE